eukprot:GEZU01027805.1.p2 GENE.GEZU01027805.1~~GEZU01027805.1.p2  ORF type:complete len:110 (+),score=20.04 GEZU01027805.1:49-378(+)
MDPEHQFFGDNEAPSTLAQVEKQTLEFADFHFQHNRKIVLVTSGGTNVPLEKNTVRFVTNFSTGGRGANSTEYPPSVVVVIIVVIAVVIAGLCDLCSLSLSLSHFARKL